MTAVVLENIAFSEKEERGQFAAHPQRITPIPTVGAPQSKAKAAAKKSKGRGEGDGAAETVTLEQSRQVRRRLRVSVVLSSSDPFLASPRASQLPGDQ